MVDETFSCRRCGADITEREAARFDDVNGSFVTCNYPCFNEVETGEPLLDGSRWTFMQGLCKNGEWHIPSGIGWPEAKEKDSW